ncbi:YokU family protein [Alkalihalobacillus pseudalcaliphilus]|uniref:YokU family protein n=1 Tax=Alkalihalobacillus pseudalcaliphilus TaxID=79884 RepID=UPI00064DD288|nr:YokU family protein [Alkalihalobacillus pseudalcaliphilus]KMK76679.1 hypothetical protein AB990_13200 [Alkalihalobacillus pseudalcaliphilus]
MKCNWCDQIAAKEIMDSVFWELPSGLRAIEIKATPTICCEACSMVYQQDEIVEEIEDQLMLIKSDELPTSITYRELMEIPKLLKKNYFRF